MTNESMKPYPAYKDSGIEWIGEIPEGWEIKPLKHVVKLINEKQVKDVLMRSVYKRLNEQEAAEA